MDDFDYYEDTCSDCQAQANRAIMRTTIICDNGDTHLDGEDVEVWYCPNCDDWWYRHE